MAWLAVAVTVAVPSSPVARMASAIVLALGIAMAHRFDAVFVVSNDVVRDNVARACESLGVPWYGPTFDS